MANAWVRVDDAAVSSFLDPGQPVEKHVHDVAKLTKYFAAGHINNRTGTLARMIQVNRPTKTGPFTGKALVFTRTSYAIYVHEGTGRIYPKNGKYLAIPKHRQGAPNPSGGTLRKVWRADLRKGHKAPRPYFTATSVNGQKANPFLAKGLHEAMGTLG